MNWPAYGDISSGDFDPKNNVYFKIENSTYQYIDFPNYYIYQFMNEIARIAVSCPHQPEEQYEKALELKEEYERIFYEEGIDFLTFSILKRQENPLLFSISVQIDEQKFKDFMERFPTSRTPLKEKYRYLWRCRLVSLEVASKSEEPVSEVVEDVQEKVQEYIDEDLRTLEDKINAFLANSGKWRETLQIFWGKRRIGVSDIYPSTFICLLEMEGIVRHIRSLIFSGSIPSCYREMRKLLEDLSWAIFDDFLFMYYRSKPNKDPFYFYSEYWFQLENTRENRRNFENKVNELRDRIYDHCAKPDMRYADKYGIGKGQVKAELKKRMSLPLYIMLAGTYPLQIDKFKPLLYKTFELVLKGLKGGRGLGKSDKKFVEEMGDLVADSSGGNSVPPFPSTRGVISFLEDIWHDRLENRLTNIYDQYGFFNHPYMYSWQVYTLSSIAEFKILNCEVSNFIDSITDLMETYMENYR
ncbi:MAG: hypothetical protein ACOC5L_02210 [Halobacteriota archaeon]